MKPIAGLAYIGLFILACVYLFCLAGCGTCQPPEVKGRRYGAVLECKPFQGRLDQCLIYTKTGLKTVKLKRCE